MERKCTVIEALQMIADDLANIAVPRYLNQQIGVPIDNAVSLIVKCIEALTVKNTEQGIETQEDGDKPAE